MDGRLHAADPPASDPYDWVAHNRQVIRAVRQAHYCRTQQFDRLAALEREEQAERARAVVPDHDVATPTGADSAPWRRPVASWLAPLTMCWLLLRVLLGRRPRVIAPSDATLEGTVQQAAAALATVARVVPPSQRAAILATATDVIQWEATTPEAVGPITRRLSYDLIAAGMRSHLEVPRPGRYLLAHGRQPVPRRRCGCHRHNRRVGGTRRVQPRTPHRPPADSPRRPRRRGSGRRLADGDGARPRLAPAVAAPCCSRRPTG